MSFTKQDYEKYASRIKLAKNEEILQTAEVFMSAGSVQSKEGQESGMPFFAYLVHNHTKNRNVLRVAQIQKLMSRNPALTGPLNQEFLLYTGLFPHKNLNRGPYDEHFKLVGKKYWIGFRFSHPKHDERQFFSALTRSLGRTQTSKPMDRKKVDNFAKALIAKYKKATR